MAKNHTLAVTGPLCVLSAYISSTGGASVTGGDAFSVVDVQLVIDHQPVVASARIIAQSTLPLILASERWSIATSLTLSPGTHAIAVSASRAISGGNTTTTVSGGPGAADRGMLTAIVVAL